MVVFTKKQKEYCFARAIVLLVVLMTILTACASVPASQTAVTLTFVCSPFEQTYFESAAKQFHQNNPDILVKVLPSSAVFSEPPTDFTDTANLLEQVARQADVFIWSVDGVADGQKGLIHNLTPFFDSSVNWEKDAYFPEMKSSYTSQGDVWGIPYSVDPTLVIYDPNAFREMNLEQPEYDWTWNDLVVAAQELTLYQNQDVLRYGFTDFGLLGANAAILENGISNTAAQSTVLALDNPQIITSVQQHVELSLKEHVWLGVATVGNPSAIEMVQRGEAAMSLVRGKTWLTAYDESLSTLGIVPLPDNSAAHLTGLYMSDGTSHAAAAWRWMAYLSQNIPPQLALPARRSLLSRSTGVEQMPQSFSDAAIYAAEHYHAPMYPNKLVLLLQQALEQILVGKDVVETLAEAQVYLEKSDSTVAKTEFSVPTPAATSNHPVPHASLEDRELITFMTFEKWLYESLVETFHEQQSYIGVVVREPIIENAENVTSLSAQLHGFEEADCFLSPTSPHFASVRERVLDLTPFAEASMAFPWEDYTAQALTAATYEGELWGLPAGLKPSVLWYNPALFEKADLSPPQSNWTWSDALQVAHTLSSGEENLRNYGLAIMPYERLWMLLESAAGPLWDESTIPQTPQFNMPESIAVAEQLAQLVDTGVIPNAARPEAQQTIRRLISENRVAMWLMGARECEFVEGRTFPYADTACLPASMPKPNLDIVLPQVYYISADTEHAQACWQWLQFVSDRALPYRYIPPRTSLIESDEFGGLVGSEAQFTYLEISTEAPSITLFDIDTGHDVTYRAYTWLEQALAEIIWQGGNAETHLNLATYRAETYVTCLRRCQDMYDQQCADTCFNQADAIKSLLVH